MLFLNDQTNNISQYLKFILGYVKNYITVIPHYIICDMMERWDDICNVIYVTWNENNKSRKIVHMYFSHELDFS